MSRIVIPAAQPNGRQYGGGLAALLPVCYYLVWLTHKISSIGVIIGVCSFRNGRVISVVDVKVISS